MENIKAVEKIERYRSRNYFLVFLLIANSGLPFFSGPKYLIVFIIITFVISLNNLIKINIKPFIRVLLLLTFLVIGQTITTSVFQAVTTISLYVRWIYPFLVLHIVKDEFPKIYINILIFLTIISFILFIPSLLFPNFEKELLNLSQLFYQTPSGNFYSYNSNILIYTIKPEYAIEDVAFFKRNSGAFGEPGDFGIFLIVALIFLWIYETKLFTKKSVVLIFGIISTWSTATFLAFAAFLFLYGLLILKQKKYRIVFVPLVILAVYYSYTELPFFSNRIERSIVYFENRDSVSNVKRDRMVSAIVDLKTFRDNPIFGSGRAMEARFGSSNFTWETHRNNGLTDFLVKYGIFFFLFYFYNIWSGYKRFSEGILIKNKTYAYIALITIIILGFSQTMFQKPLFIALFYLHAFYKHKNNNELH